MLILAFLSLTLFPYHYHLHHIADPLTHDLDIQNHVIDIHGYMDISGFSHHDASHTVQPTTDISLKKPGIQLPWVVILVALLFALHLFAQQGRQHPLSVKHRPPRFNYYTSPPLRAPPRT